MKLISLSKIIPSTYSLAQQTENNRINPSTINNQQITSFGHNIAISLETNSIPGIPTSFLERPIEEPILTLELHPERGIAPGIEHQPASRISKQRHLNPINLPVVEGLVPKTQRILIGYLLRAPGPVTEIRGGVLSREVGLEEGELPATDVVVGDTHLARGVGGELGRGFHCG